jgi:hypothetical protein
MYLNHDKESTMSGTPIEQIHPGQKMIFVSDRRGDFYACDCGFSAWARSIV